MNRSWKAAPPSMRTNPKAIMAGFTMPKITMRVATTAIVVALDDESIVGQERREVRR